MVVRSSFLPLAISVVEGANIFDLELFIEAVIREVIGRIIEYPYREKNTAYCKNRSSEETYKESLAI